ncbi:methyltransferase [Bacillus cereus group sp. Bc252]|uniref:methyltransferase n=1 Tax=Bacillus cereus group sp. Bc252 TaxID=3018104 RepID=UPI0022DF728D|nr:methyltransferase [Bacillus cereus group sp. Bc252]MDA2164202.1 methyltransferase [Bacillus cereus group sp. Bc252]
MIFKKLNIEKILDDQNEKDTPTKKSYFIPVFLVSIIVSICMAFIQIKLTIITLFAPAILVMLYDPPFSRKKGAFRLLLLVYLFVLIGSTILWYIKG